MLFHQGTGIFFIDAEFLDLPVFGNDINDGLLLQQVII
jgi:hypothetical protein